VTTSPWLGKALLENVTSRRILGTSLLDKEILKDYMFRSNPPDGTSLQYLDGILISVWFAFIKRVVTLHFWCHCCGYGHMISLKLSANWGFGSRQESSTTALQARKRVETWSLFSFRPASEENQSNFQDLPISHTRNLTQGPRTVCILFLDPIQFGPKHCKHLGIQLVLAPKAYHPRSKVQCRDFNEQQSRWN
jgi:hypothetical protein